MTIQIDSTDYIFAGEHPDCEIGQKSVDQLQWSHIGAHSPYRHLGKIKNHLIREKQ